MQRNVTRHAARVSALASAAAFVATLGCVTLAHAQTPPSLQNAPNAPSGAAPMQTPVDPTFSAYSLAQTCKQKSDNVAQGQCVGAVRGIIHGYQYGVLFVGQRASMSTTDTQRVALCLRNTPVSQIVDEFVGDAAQVSDDSLKRTPAEVAVLGSVHMHHACN